MHASLSPENRSGGEEVRHLGRSAELTLDAFSRHSLQVYFQKRHLRPTRTREYDPILSELSILFLLEGDIIRKIQF